MSGNKRNVFTTLGFEVDQISEEKLAAYKPGDKIESDVFTITVDGKATEWLLFLYPNGLKEKYKDHMSLFLQFKKTELDNFKTKHQFGIRNKTSNYVLHKIRKSDWKLGEGYGLPQWISHADLFDPENDYIVDGKLKIFCELTITTVKRNEEPTVENVKGLVTDYSEMFQKEELKDCELHLRVKKVLKCHKFVLAARSVVFYNMFSTNMVEARNNVVDIIDIDLETMTQLVRFCYGLDIEDLDEIAHKLILAADKYQMEELKEICIDSLISSLSQENVLRSLTIADHVPGSAQLYEDCLDLIVNFYHSLADTREWKNLPRRIVRTLLNHMTSRCNSSTKMSSAKSL